MTDSADEYGPVMATWGSQTTTDPIASWHSLADPNAKLNANGLGSGQLHRKGKNFVPISEEDILAHRMGHGSSKKKLVSKESMSKNQTRKNSTKPFKRTETPAQQPPSKTRVNNMWNSQSLVETPFWENKSSDQKTAAAHWQTTNQAVSPPQITNTSNSEKNSASGWNHEDKKTPKMGKNIEISNNDGWGVLQTTTNDNINSWDKSKKTAQWGTKTDNENKNWKTSEPKYRETFSTNRKSDGWGVQSVPKDEFASNNWNTFTENETHKSEKPLWLDPDQDSPKPDERYQFSNPNKKKYSDYKKMSIPRPMNYQRNNEIPMPTQVAPAPPPENSVLVTILVQLNDTLKVPVKIRDLDVPQEIAKEFALENNVNKENVIKALTNLFESQKAAALKKKNQKLQKRTYNSSYSKYSSNGNYYNKHTQNSSNNCTYNSPQNAPFTRSQYY